MPPPLDLTGQRFGRLTVTGDWEVRKSGQQRCWRCLCDCGKETWVCASSLTTGNTKSCGCFQREARRKHGHTVGGSIGKPPSPTYCSWVQMLYRCRNPNRRMAHRYNKRGITACERWERLVNDRTTVYQKRYHCDIDRSDLRSEMWK
jgi:hypothetical protein